jgi:hypothetical protein
MLSIKFFNLLKEDNKNSKKILEEKKEKLKKRIITLGENATCFLCFFILLFVYLDLEQVELGIQFECLEEDEKVIEKEEKVFLLLIKLLFFLLRLLLKEKLSWN